MPIDRNAAVDGLGGMDDGGGLLRGEFARIAELGEQAFVAIQIADGGFVGDGENDLVAALLGLSDLPEPGARRDLGEGFVVAVDVLRVSQLAGLAGNAAQELEG